MVKFEVVPRLCSTPVPVLVFAIQAIRGIFAAQSVPPELEEAADVEALVAFPFADVPGVDGLDAEEHEAYRGTHRIAIRAMLQWLRNQH